MVELLETICPNIMNKLPEFSKALVDTLIMLGVTGIVSLVFGIIFGMILVVTKEDGILKQKIVYFIVGKIVDFFRAIPFLILITLLTPVTRALMGTTIQLKGALFPLIVGTIPFFARQIESALCEINKGLIEASQAMGLTPFQMMTRVYLKESVPSIIRAITITLIALIGYITMVGVIGGGGIGDFCIRYGYNGFEHDVTVVCVIVLLILTSCIQGIGNYFVKRTSR